MGLPMAGNLAIAGYKVYGYDANISASAAMPHDNLTLVGTLPECMQDAEIVITMLPNGAIVLDVLQQIIDASQSSATIVDCSTIDINDARLAHKLASEAGHVFFDAPVSGGTKGASAGTLTAMIGGNESQLNTIGPLLKPIFNNVIYCGNAGNGQAAKICNNMLLATSMIGTAETFNLGQKLGLDAKTLFDILSSSTGSCWSVNSYCPVTGVGPQSPADNDFKPGFSGHMMLKDMKLTQDAARSVDVATPLGALSTRLYKEFVELGGGPEDFSAIIKHLQTLDRQTRE